MAVQGEKPPFASLIESESWFRSFVEASLDIISVHAPDSTMQYISPAAKVILGYEPEELIGRRAYDFFHEDDIPSIGEAHTQTLEAPDQQLTTYRFRRKDGSYCWLQSSLQAIRDDKTDEVAGMYLVTRDVNAIKATELALRASEDRTRRILETANEAYIEVDPKGVILEWNREAERLLGWTRDEVRGQMLIDLIVPKRQHPLRLNGPVPGIDFINRRTQVPVVDRSGNEFPVDVTVWATGTEERPAFSVFLVDIRERLRLESELQIAQKLEVLGRVAGGMAHEINTPVQYVGDNLNFLAEAFDAMLRAQRAYGKFFERVEATQCSEHAKSELDAALADEDLTFYASEVPAAIEQTQSGIDRVANIVRAMRSLGRVAPTEAAPADINQIIRDALTIVDTELKYVADLHVDLDLLPPVQCHGAELGQAIINLLVNAGHAVADSLGPNKKRGVVTVRTMRAGDSVSIVISDDGVGIEESIAGRIFDPFFTTKEFGRGTGQGLAQAYGVICDQHHGTLTLNSEAGHGATFVIGLPIAGVPSAD